MKSATGHVAGQVAGQVNTEVGRLLKVMKDEMSRVEIQVGLALKSRTNFEERYLKPARAAGLIELTIPDKPKSRLQKYRLSEAGRAWLADRTFEPNRPCCRVMAASLLQQRLKPRLSEERS